MIEELTAKKLKKYGFDGQTIVMFQKVDNYEAFSLNGESAYWASNIEHRIYSDVDGWYKYYFRNEEQIAFPIDYPDLIREYYRLNLSLYLKNLKKVIGIIFNEKAEIEKFRQNEIVLAKNSIKALEDSPMMNIQIVNKIKVMKGYVESLDRNEFAASFSSQEYQPNSEPLKPKVTVTFKPEAIQDILNLIKNYFPNQNSELQCVLETGDISNGKLLFNGSGKMLFDFFKQLLKGQFIIVTSQKDFEIWMSTRFEFLHGSKRMIITPKYASRTISGNERAAKGHRLIDVKNVNGKFEISLLEIGNREQK